MAIKAAGNKLVKPGMLGYGDRVDKSSQNFIGGNRWMQHIERGTLKINPELADKSLDDILTDAGLNFPVYAVPTFFTSPVSGITYPSESYSVIRGDTDYELGKGFSDGYQPISYPDILDQFFQNTKKLGGVPTRAVSFQNGAKGAIQFAMPDEYLVADRPHKTFLNFYSSHDGTFGVTMNECDICIICGNTFAFSFRDTTARWTVKHTKNMQNTILGIRDQILSAEYAPVAYYQMLDKSATIKATDGTIKEFLFAMFPDVPSKEDNTKVNQGPANRRITLENDIANTAAERNTNDITVYDVFQGALRNTSYRTQNRNQDEQFDYAMNSKVNQNAYNWLVEAVK